jgi:hypothetical protein
MMMRNMIVALVAWHRTAEVRKKDVVRSRLSCDPQNGGSREGSKGNWGLIDELPAERRPAAKDGPKVRRRDARGLSTVPVCSDLVA